MLLAEFDGGTASGAVLEVQEDGHLSGIRGEGFPDIGEIALGVAGGPEGELYGPLGGGTAAGLELA